jgi:transcriptional regulator with XRE-family HTH domain
MAKKRNAPRELARVLRVERRKAGLSQYVLAAKAKMSQGIVAQLERAQSPSPGLGSIFDLADALKIPIDRFIEAYRRDRQANTTPDVTEEQP